MAFLVPQLPPARRPPRRARPHTRCDAAPRAPRRAAAGGAARCARLSPRAHAVRLVRLARRGDIGALDAAVADSVADGFVLNAVNYTMLAHAKIAAGDAAGALALLREMRAAGVRPRNATLRTGLRAVGRDAADVRWLLEWYREEGEDGGEVKSWNMALALLARRCAEGDGASPAAVAAWEEMWAICRTMLVSGGRPAEDGTVRVPPVDVYTLNTMLAACRRRNDVDGALGIFGRMRVGRTVRPDIVSYNTVLALLVGGAVRDPAAGAGKLLALLLLLQRRAAAGAVVPDRIMHTLLLQVVTCRHRDVALPALAVEPGGGGPARGIGDRLGATLARLGWREGPAGAGFEEGRGPGGDLPARRAPPEPRSPYSERARRLIRRLWRNVPPDMPLDQRYYNTLIAAFARVGDTPGAVLALREMRKRDGLDADLYTYNALLSAAGRAADVSLATRLLATLQRHRRYAPDAFSYSAALTACRRDVKASTGVLQDAVASGLACTPPMLNAALQCYGGDIQTALDVWLAWRSSDVFSAAAGDLQVYRALMRSAGMAGQPDAALRLLLAGKRRGEVDPATSLGMFGAFTRGMREGGQTRKVRRNILSSQYLAHLRLECRAFDNAERSALPVERVRIRW